MWCKSMSYYEKDEKKEVTRKNRLRALLIITMYIISVLHITITYFETKRKEEQRNGKNQLKKSKQNLKITLNVYCYIVMKFNVKNVQQHQ